MTLTTVLPEKNICTFQASRLTVNFIYTDTGIVHAVFKESIKGVPV
jgi:hypothetical protein